MPIVSGGGSFLASCARRFAKGQAVLAKPEFRFAFPQNCKAFLQNRKAVPRKKHRCFSP